MKIVGLFLVIAGWLIPVGSLTFTQSLTARYVLATIGIIISLIGILGILNHDHLKKAIWKV